MAEHSHPTRAVYLIIFLALAAGTCLTWGIAFVDLGPWNPVIALTIACTKATLVILYFMHVRYSSKLTILTVCAGFFWLMILITLSLTDYLTRTGNAVSGWSTASQTAIKLRASPAVDRQQQIDFKRRF